MQFIALSFIVLSIGCRFETGEANRYLPIGLFLTGVASFANLAIQKMKKKEK